MNHYWLFAFLIIYHVGLQIAALAGVRALSPDPRPRLTVAPRVADFQEAVPGVWVKRAFRLMNTGGQPLKITSVRPVCNCTHVGTWSPTLAPGKSEILEVRIDTSHLLGRVDKSVRIQSNDSEQPVQFVKCQGNIVSPILLSSQRIFFGFVNDGDRTPSQTIEIRNNRKERLQLNFLTSPNTFFQARLEASGNGNLFALRVNLRPALKPGWNNGFIFLQPLPSSGAGFTIPVSAYRLDRVYLRPIAVVLPPGPLFQPVQKSVFIFYSASPDFSINYLKASNPKITVRMQRENSSRRYRINLDFPSLFQSRKETLLLETNDPEFRTFRIPIFQSPAGGKQP